MAAAATATADDERTSLLTSAADDGSSECTEEGIGIACCFDRASRTLIGERMLLPWYCYFKFKKPYPSA